MKMAVLGNTGLRVSTLCFGTLPMGPLESNISIPEGAKVLRKAFELGVNFVDTAHTYRTYEYIREAKRGWDNKLIIATKFGLTAAGEVKDGVEKALNDMELDYLDIVLLHSARAEDPFVRFKETLAVLKEYKTAGKIKHIGLSSHSVVSINQAAVHPDIEVIHPLINYKGLGIISGTAEDMVNSIKIARGNGKGVYAMKVFAGGNLLDNYSESIDYIVKNEIVDSMAIGMVTEQEVAVNAEYITTGKIPSTEKDKIRTTGKHVIVLGFCKGCGKCVETCPNFAITLVDKKAVVEKEKCLICGYCGGVCPELAIRVV
ncbi:MAG: aldo/keto reductase [Elusimicrobiota bacterium]